MKITLFFLALTFHFTNLIAQSSWYHLSSIEKTANSLKDLSEEENKFDSLIYKYNTQNISNAKISYLVFDVKPFNYAFFKIGEIDSLTFKSLAYNKDDYINPDFNWRLLCLRGKYLNKDIIILDLNMNHDFNDDEIFYIPEPNRLVDKEEKKLGLVYPPDTIYTSELVYDYKINNVIHHVPLKISFGVKTKFDTINQRIGLRDGVFFGYNELLFYKGEIGGDFVEITFRNVLPWQTEYLEIRIKSNNQTQSVITHESFKIGENILRIDSVDILNKRLMISSVVGDLKTKIHLLPIAFTGTQKQNTTHFLYHFWGSWCRPCIQNMGKLVSLNEKYQSINVVGIAVDNGKDVVAKAIKKNNLTWNHVLYDKEQAKIDEEVGATISAYPTYILTDNNYKILIKTGNLDEVIEKIKQIGL